MTIVHRREVDLDDIAQKCSVTFDELQKAKVTQHVLDMEKMCENDEVIAENAEKFKDHDVIFCVLGQPPFFANTPCDDSVSISSVHNCIQ